MLAGARWRGLDGRRHPDHAHALRPHRRGARCRRGHRRRGVDAPRRGRRAPRPSRAPSTSPTTCWTAERRCRSPGSTSARSPCPATRGASIAYYAHGFVFSGDVLFSGSVGRTDFDGGDHGQLLQSIDSAVRDAAARDGGGVGPRPDHHARGRARHQPVPGRAAAVSGKFQAPRGTSDWFGDDAAPPARRSIDAAARCSRDGRLPRDRDARPSRTPSVYARTSGEGSDVVRKEMYTFRDRSDRSLTLRPEGTAGVVRAYIEHGMSHLPQPIKSWYVAPMFRYAAVQRGRFREHYQFGVEVLGSEDPGRRRRGDRAAARAGTRGVGVTAYELELNSIGDANCRPAYLELLVAFLDAHAGRALRASAWSGATRIRCGCSTARTRAARPCSPTRPKITDHLCDACAEHFAAGARVSSTRAGVAVRDLAGAGARARLLHPHGVGVRHHRARRTGHDRRRRPLRRPGRAARRPADARRRASARASSGCWSWSASRGSPASAALGVFRGRPTTRPGRGSTP